MNEFAVWQRGSTLTLDEGVEGSMQVGVQHPVGLSEGIPLAPVRQWKPGEGRRQRWIFDLERIAGGDPHPGDPGRWHRGEGNHVVLHDHVRPDLLEDLLEPTVHEYGAVDELAPDRPDQR